MLLDVLNRLLDYDEFIYITEKLKNDMSVMRELELKPKNFGIRVRNNSEELKITAYNKMRNSTDEYEYESYFGGVVEPKYTNELKISIADDYEFDMDSEDFKKNGMYALPVDCRSGKALNAYLPLVREILKDKIQKNTEKGMAGKPLRVMVVGIPNTGKSSFINRMGKNAKAKVADKAGVTKQNQWFNVGNGIELLDTPGVLWPKFDDPQIGDKLAFIGSVKDEVVDTETLAMRLIGVLKNGYSDRLTERFKITDFEDKEDYEILEMIGRKRGMLISGGEIDYERASVMLLDEYRGGKLGRLSLDFPE